MSSSVGIILPNIWKNKIHVPNHQPELYPWCYITCINFYCYAKFPIGEVILFFLNSDVIPDYSRITWNTMEPRFGDHDSYAESGRSLNGNITIGDVMCW